MTMNNIWIDNNSKNSHCFACAASEIGGRKEQQDMAYIRMDENSLLAVLCDGMGGGEGGSDASRLTVETFKKYAESYVDDMDCVAFLYETMLRADATVVTKIGKDRSGSTLAAVLVHNNLLYWISVGDSRIYIKRGSELLQVTRDHNYYLRLSQMLRNGKITDEQFKTESNNGDALISYIGRGKIEIFDLTRSGFVLRQGDVILIASDGLYKAVPESEIGHVLSSETRRSNVPNALVAKVSESLPQKAQDNTTIIAIFYD